MGRKGRGGRGRILSSGSSSMLTQEELRRNGRPLAAGMGAGENQFGDNSAPVSAYAGDGPATPMFLPGNPLRPVPGLQDGEQGPRQYAYHAGTNIIPAPRHDEAVSFDTLRNLASLYEGIQICQKAIFRVVRRLRLQVVPRAEFLDAGEDGLSDRWAAQGRAMAEWLEFPERPTEAGRDLSSWLAAALRDNLELDAVAVFHRRTRGGQLHGLELVAGDTIAPLIDAGGRVPAFPAPAYAQVLYGVVGSLWTEMDIDYLVEHPRTDSHYGVSPVESILLRVNQALRKEHYDLTRFTDGAVPAGFMETTDPKLSTMRADQLATIERQWNAVLAGNDALRVRVRMIPPGWTLKTTPREEIATDFDRWLLNLTAAAHGLTMDELGFTETSNRSVGDAQERVVYRNSVQPRAEFFARYLTRVIRRYSGQPIFAGAPSLSAAGRATRRAYTWDARYIAQWTGIDEPQDFLQQVQAAQAMVQSGILNRDEARRWLKLPREILRETGHGPTP